MMDRAEKFTNRRWHVVFALGAVFLLTTGFTASAQSAGYQNLSVVKPVMSCDQLAQADMSKFTDAKITIKTAKLRETDKA